MFRSKLDQDFNEKFKKKTNMTIIINNVFKSLIARMIMPTESDRK